MKLNEEFFHKIVAKIAMEGEPEDLAKFVLSGKEVVSAAQRYFNNLEGDKKRKLYLKDDTWWLTSVDDIFLNKTKTHMGLPLIKMLASSIVPFVEVLSIVNPHLKDYSFLNNIEHLNCLNLEFEDQEYMKVLSALSSLKSVNNLWLDIKHLNLQILKSLSFSFQYLIAMKFTFETNPKCDKIFQAQDVELCGDDELKNDFIFTRENYLNYAAIFPNAINLKFEFHIKVVDDFTDLLKVSNNNHAAKVNVSNRDINCHYKFYDYSGFPESKVLTMLQNDENWYNFGCPYKEVLLINDNVSVSCSFPLAIEEIGKRIAQNTVRRIPENSNGNREDYYQLTIQNDWGHKTEFKVLKTTSIENLLKVYLEITGIDAECFGFEINDRYVIDGTIADNFQDGNVLFFYLKFFNLFFG